MLWLLELSPLYTVLHTFLHYYTFLEPLTSKDILLVLGINALDPTNPLC